MHLLTTRIKEINSLYLTLGLLYFGERLLSIFIPIYLWELGLPLSRIIFFYFLHSGFFLLIAFTALPWMRRMSDKYMMLASIFPLIAYLWGLQFISENLFLFYMLPFLLSAHLVLFNVGYHISFAGASDDTRIGRQVGTRDIVTTIASFSAPFVGGIIISWWGFNFTFFIGAIIAFLAILPLFFYTHRVITLPLTHISLLNFLRDRSLLPFNISAAGYAVENTASLVMWSLFIFFAIGKIENVGGIISLGLLVEIIVYYLAGVLSDAGKRRTVLTATTGFLSVLWLIRPFLKNQLPIAANHIAAGTLRAGLLTAWSSQYYAIARSFRDPTGFILSREILFHLARVTFLPILIIFSKIFSLSIFFTVGFFITALITLLLLAANRTNDHPHG